MTIKSALGRYKYQPTRTGAPTSHKRGETAAVTRPPSKGSGDEIE